MNARVVITADGSRTLTADAMGAEIFHSRHGALAESMYVFVGMGLDLFKQPKEESPDAPVRLFEVGFGTGLNALVAMQWAQTHQRPVFYLGLEPNRLPVELLAELNYPELLSVAKEHFLSMHRESYLTVPYFEARIETVRVEAYDKDDHQYDLCWFDAFSPRFDPDIWAEPVFQKIFDMLAPGGILVTYSAKGEVQRMLRGIGYELEKLQGPPGKREMIRARKPSKKTDKAPV